MDGFGKLVSKSVSAIGGIKEASVLNTVLNKINRYYKTKFDFIGESYGTPIQSPLMLLFKYSNISMSLMKLDSDLWLNSLVDMDRLQVLDGSVDYEDTVNIPLTEKEKEVIVDYVIKSNSKYSISRLLQELTLGKSEPSFTNITSPSPLTHYWDSKHFVKLFECCDLKYVDENGNDMLDSMFALLLKKDTFLIRSIWTELFSGDLLKNRVQLMQMLKKQGVKDSENPYRLKTNFLKIFELIKENGYTDGGWFGDLFLKDNNLKNILSLVDFNYCEPFEGGSHDSLISGIVSNFGFLNFIVGRATSNGNFPGLYADELLDVVFRRSDMKSLNYMGCSTGPTFLSNVFLSGSTMMYGLNNTQQNTLRDKGLVEYIIDNSDFNIKDISGTDGLVSIVKNADLLEDDLLLSILDKTSLNEIYSKQGQESYNKGLVAYCLENINVFKNKEKSLTEILYKGRFFDGSTSLLVSLKKEVCDFFKNDNHSIENKESLFRIIIADSLRVDGVFLNNEFEISRIVGTIEKLNKTLIKNIEGYDENSLCDFFVAQSQNIREATKENTEGFYGEWLSPSIKPSKIKIA